MNINTCQPASLVFLLHQTYPINPLENTKDSKSNPMINKKMPTKTETRERRQNVVIKKPNETIAKPKRKKVMKTTAKFEFLKISNPNARPPTQVTKEQMTISHALEMK